MTTKLVLRLLDGGGALLGWCAIMAIARGDAMLRAIHDVIVPIDRDGTPAVCSVHWCDVNVEIKLPLVKAERVQARTHLSVFKSEDQILSLGTMPTDLAPITVGSVSIGVPIGNINATHGDVSIVDPSPSPRVQ